MRLILLAVLLTLTACIKTPVQSGYSLDMKKLEEIEAGQTRKNTVIRLLGSPSAKSSFGKEVWYYISREYERIAFLKPKLKAQKVIALSFEDKVVSSVSYYDEAEAKEVAFSKDKTLTEGHDIGVIEQLLGNIGRFNQERNPLGSRSGL